ncbi:MAG: ribosomal protein S18-alanine N-acetyltransferase [Pseudomonadales bacterium]
MQLRALKRSDVSTLLQIEEQLNAFPWREQNFVDSLRADHLSRCLTIDDNVVGFAIFSVVATEATLLNLGVATKYHGQGLGKQLLESMLELVKNEGAEICLLEVRQSNAVAQDLYHALGFYEVGRRGNYYPAKKGREDAILMNLPLAEITHM